ncbi:hypothetical protein JNUCC64_00450 [Streptomyces sp. JNUCC 64]
MRQRSRPTAHGSFRLLHGWLWGMLLLLVGAAPAAGATWDGSGQPPAVLSTAAPRETAPSVDPRATARTTDWPGPVLVHTPSPQEPVTAVAFAAAGEQSGRPVPPPPSPTGAAAPAHEVALPRGGVVDVRRERGPPPPPSGPRSTRAPPASGAVDV